MAGINLPDHELEHSADILARVLYMNRTGKILEDEFPPDLARAKRDFVRRLRFAVVRPEEESEEQI